MWISLNWIKDFVDYDSDLSPDELGVLISLRVAEVEGVKILGEGLSQVRVVEVTKAEPHPDSDKLQLATVTDGTEERTIVCGAPNCRAGIKVPFADLGSKFNVVDKEGNPSVFEIKPIKIRGVESTGMLCSESELGLADKSDGIWELDADTPTGAKLEDLEQFTKLQDVLFEIDNKSLTHRPDLWGHYGLAREFSAIYNVPLKDYPGADLNGSGNSTFSINNETPDLCRRYSALEIRNVKVGPSPQWLQDRLNSVGMNTINNLVDVTNYILLELGQPMHAFDVDKLNSKVMGIRRANEGEVFKALDEKDYPLTAEDLVIDNDGVAVALAGVMGGLDSGISDSTTHLVLESANFDAATVRRTSVRCGLRSDSSARFEKSLDPENTVKAINRAVQIILETCPEAEVVGSVIDSYDKPYEKLSISTSYEFLQKRLGSTAITKEFIDEKLSSLGFGISGDLEISVPSWRSTKDVSIAEDIVEEVGRMYGYDNIEASSLEFEIKPATVNKARQLERNLKAQLTNGLGFTEVMLYPWTGDKQLEEYGLSSEGLMTLKNAISVECKYMRSHSIPHFIDAIAENVKYFEEFKIFEFGRIYDTNEMQGLLPTEKFKLCGAIVPEYKKKDLQTESFYEAKTVVLDLLAVAGIQGAQVKPLEGDLNSWVHPGIAAGIYRGRQLLAEIYKLHPAIAEAKDIRNNAYLFQIHFNEIENLERKYKYKPVVKYPGVPFDVTVLTGEKVLASQIEQVINKAVKKSLRELDVFSVYHGEELGEGNKTVSFRMTFGSDNHTLKPDEVENLQNAVINALEKAGYPLR